MSLLLPAALAEGIVSLITRVGRPGRVNMPKRALVLIDFQNDYFPGGKWTLSGIESAADNAARVLAAARAAGDLVVHVRHEFPTTDAPFFAPGSSGAQLHPKIQDREGEPVVLKHHVNSFRETDLKAILDSHGVEEVVICGAMSHMCVDAGTRAASDLSLRVAKKFTGPETKSGSEVEPDLALVELQTRVEHPPGF
jgi:nicotinamidase-related amidase